MNRFDWCALAFAITGDVNSRERQETIRLLTRVLAEDPPDLILPLPHFPAGPHLEGFVDSSGQGNRGAIAQQPLQQQGGHRSL